MSSNITVTKVNYSIAFLINGTWTEDTVFKRDLFDDSPIDEELDSSIIIDIPASLAIIPPFTICRIKTINADNNAEIDKRYYLTSNRETSATTLFKPN